MIIRIITILLFATPVLAQQLGSIDAGRFIRSLISEEPIPVSWFDEMTLATSRRLGIQYDGVDAKPMIGFDIEQQIRQAIRHGRCTYAFKLDSIGANISRIVLSIGRPAAIKEYYFKCKKFVSPLDVLTQGWMVMDSDHFRFFISDSTLFNPYCIDHLEAFVSRMAVTLGLTDHDLQTLREKKIYYYLLLLFTCRTRTLTSQTCRSLWPNLERIRDMDLEYLNACDVCRSGDIRPIDADHHLSRCPRCGFIFDNPRPVHADILKFYSRETQYDAWLSEETGRDALWKRRLDKIVRHKSSGALLDVGTGIGQFLHFAASRFDVSGTEISESAIGVAKKKYGLEVHRGELQEVDFGSRRFDAITLFHVLEHVPSPSLLVAKCAELLSGGGILVIAVPNEIESLIKRPIKRLLSVLGIGKFASYGKFGLPKIELDGTLGEIHLSHFTAPVVRQLLRRQNFVVIDEGLDPYYSATGIKGMLHRLIYLVFAAIHTITHRNFYDAIWVVAKRG